MASDKKWHMHEKRSVQNFSENGGAFEVSRGGGGKNSRAIFKVSESRNNNFECLIYDYLLHLMRT